MSDEIKRGPKSPLRRKLLMGMAALPAISMLPRTSFADVPPTSGVNTTGLAVTDTEATVGILHSVTGTMAISETGSVEAKSGDGQRDPQPFRSAVLAGDPLDVVRRVSVGGLGDPVERPLDLVETEKKGTREQWDS
jgi:hypothetical protein